jgi:hypothetical protein
MQMLRFKEVIHSTVVTSKNKKARLEKTGP